MFLSPPGTIPGPLKIRAERSKTRLHGWDHERIYRPPADHSWSIAGPAMGPRKPLSSLLWAFQSSCGSLKKVQKRRLTGNRRGAYTPRLTQTGRPATAQSEAAD